MNIVVIVNRVVGERMVCCDQRWQGMNLLQVRGPHQGGGDGDRGHCGHDCR